MDTLNFDLQIALRIIKAQEMIIGPLAWDEAKKVSGFLVIDQKKEEVSFNGDAKEILNKLVVQYEHLFGRASDEVCKEAVQDLIAEMKPDEVPESLK
jgi:translation initiation factor 2 alpha subunit (eIF-2alpha)